MIQSPIIFVFGSNLDGNHAGGAARFAHLHHGAVMGVGEGLTGTSYALPTVGKSFTTMTLAKVREHVNTFIRFATSHPELDFKVTRVGCGIAGFTDAQSAPLFLDSPTNCTFDPIWHAQFSLPVWKEDF
jgi:hypothetical protein